MSQARFEGRITWIGRSNNERTVSTVDDAVLNGDALSFDTSTSLGRYTVTMQGAVGEMFKGRWRGNRSGTCSARVFNSDGGLFLFGEWVEDEAYDWWADLFPVEVES